MVNNLLPNFAQQCVVDDAERNHQEIDKSIADLKKSEIVEPKTLGRILKLIQLRLDLKYQLEDTWRSFLVSFMLQLYKEKRLSIPLKTRLLNILTRLCKNKNHNIVVSPFLDWELFWEEMISLSTRAKKYEIIASEHVIGRLMQSQMTFLHSARRLISDEQALCIAERAMAHLKDLRNLASVEGVLLLVICLPTNFSGYAKYVPEWLSAWSKIDHNTQWDASFLTLLARARKSNDAASSIDWASFTPYLFVKTKELLNLPGPGSSKPLNSGMYPNTFPSHYTFLTGTSPFDARKTALHKIAKLLYFQCFSKQVEVVGEPLSISQLYQTEFQFAGLNCSGICYDGAKELAMFYNSIRVYFHPSNTGSWSQDLGFLLGTQIGELSRHVGKQIALKHGGVEDIPGILTLHVPTIKYMIGVFSSLLLEMVFSKNQILAHIASFAFKNLAALLPELGHALLPTLISTLDPDSVSKSHMAPPAMSTIAITFKAFLFPKPIVLPYLSDIMKLSLPGIDPNDTKKTILTLSLYSRVLAWIPINYQGMGTSKELSLENGLCIPLLDLVSSTDLSVQCSIPTPETMFFDLSQTLADWAPMFIDKILSLLTAMEDTTQSGPETSAKGGKHRYHSVKVQHNTSFDMQFSQVSECLYLFWSAVDSKIASDCCDRIMSHIKCSPIRAIKEFTRLIDEMVSCHPELLQPTLKSLLDATVRIGECSAEKLNFRLRLAGGAVRKASSGALLAKANYGRTVDGTLEPLLESAVDFLMFYMSPDFTVNHPDLDIQNTCRKLIRDILRGLTASYPASISPSSDHEMLYGIRRCEVQPAWHTPSKKSLTKAVEILEFCCRGSIRSLNNILNLSQDTNVSKKNCEDIIISNLSVIHACSRGASEILDDDSLDILGQSIQKMEIEECEIICEIHTGREHLIAQCEDVLAVSVLRQLREEILYCLVNVHDILNDTKGINILGINQPQQIPNDTSIALFMTPDIANMWLRTFESVVMYRNSFCKDPKGAKNSFSSSKRQLSNSTVRSAKRCIERFGGINGVDPANLLKQSSFWDNYDIPNHMTLVRAHIHYALLCKEYAYSTIRMKSKSFSGDNIYSKAFERVVILCGHEFDSIRNSALKSFKKISGFGWQLDTILELLIKHVGVPATAHNIASGALNIITVPVILKRMVSQYHYSSAFLKSVTTIDDLFSSIVEPDKRHSLVNQFSNVFVSYVDKWHQFPLFEDRDDAVSLLRTISIEALRFLPPSQKDEFGTILEKSLDVIPTEQSAVGKAGGIRQEMYISYAVLHFLCHRDILMPTEAWLWALKSVCCRRGHPVLAIALAALTRLSYSAAISVPDDSVSSSHSPAPFVKIPEVVLTLLQSRDIWKGILESISHASVKKSSDTGDNAQWSNGVDRMLRSADYIQQGFPRWITNCFYQDKNSSGGAFKPHFSGLLISLFLVMSGNGFDSKFVEDILLISTQLAATNEDELRANNSVRAMLFGALARIIHISLSKSCQTDFNNTDENVKIDYQLNSFLFQETLSISFEYCRDWADAVSFAFSSSSLNFDESSIPKDIMASVGIVLRNLSSPNSGPDTDTDEGFNRHAKTLLIAKSLLHADLAFSSSNTFEEFDLTNVNSYRRHHLPSSESSALVFRLRHGRISHNSSALASSAIAQDYIDLFRSEPTSILSQYRAIRIEIAETLQKLSDAFPQNETNDLATIVDSIVNFVSIDTSDATEEEKAKYSNALEVGIMWLECASSNMTYRYTHVLEKLIRVATMGSGSFDIDLAKRSHAVVLQAVGLITRDCYGKGGRLNWLGNDHEGVDLLARILTSLSSLSSHSSWRVRSTAVLALGVLFVNNWSAMTVAEKKSCKDVFNNAFYDAKPEIQLLGRVGMSAYLGTKPLSELSLLAAAYLKNNDIFASREKKKRRLGSAAVEGEKADPVYVTTIMMSASLIAAFPYDLPSFVPALLVSLIRHATVPAFHDTVTRTIQDFKRTHQDRWEEDFRRAFSADQLADLQGAGAAHYFS